MGSTNTVAEFQHFHEEGRAPEQGMRYACRIPVAGNTVGWQACVGAGGSRFRVDKELVTSRTSFLETFAGAKGEQSWQFGGEDSVTPAPVFYLLAPVGGDVRIRHAGAETVLSAGQFTIATSAARLVVEYGEGARVIMAFAAETTVPRRSALTAALGVAQPVDETGGLLLKHVDATLRVARLLKPESLGAAADAAGELMTATLAGLPHGGTTADDRLRSRIETYVELRLRDPHLGVEQIAAAHHVSRRTVYRLFEKIGEGVASYIRGRRLDRCRADVIERPDLSVAAICERWGAGEPRHFARTYRARFGESPGDTRRRLGTEG
ncbi:helix-turn-helix domain-containing protein [Amycolatopsis sp. WQ 127309]|uniref:helix-turn-helix domain-containing protein n=1 Tax=Amycolatopsis sp. WQ 127309 TaxID=2932773 RepID=UPI001FF549C8|nr:helix-turn-helix domain-containing protein [Amycolatopsis sp. WQ 127309]UOZ06035.1 helix-turn-helix domain-containing protein [Amycolatopsis sp. WQ 127309]